MSTHTTNAIVATSKLTAIGNAIRGKTGGSAELTLDDMATAITNIPTGITPTGTININSNGTVDVTNYATASVHVPGQVTSFVGTITPVNGVNTINIPYSGSGFPVSISLIALDGLGSGSALSSLIEAGAIGYFFTVKDDLVAPVWSAGSTSSDFCPQMMCYKSDSSSTDVGNDRTDSYKLFYDSDPTQYKPIYMRNNTTLALYGKNSGTSFGKHFSANLTYIYVIAYSS